MAEVTPSQYDVIIAGAGVAGLVAAETMLSRDANLQVLVLGPSPDEDSADEVSSSQMELLQLVDRLKLETLPDQPPDAAQKMSGFKKLVQVGRKGRVRPISSDRSHILPTRPARHTGFRSWLAGLELSYVTWCLDRMCHAVDPMQPFSFFGAFGNMLQQPSDFDAMTMSTYLRLTSRSQSVRDVIHIQFRICGGVELDQISLLYALVYIKSQYPDTAYPFSSFLRGDPTTTRFRIKNGAVQVRERLASVVGRHRVRPAEAITGVEYRHDGGAFLQTEAGKVYLCSRLVIAVPPHFISSIAFSPALEPTRKYYLDHCFTGTMIRFELVYERRFWLEDGFSGEVISNGGRKESGGGNAETPVTWLRDGTHDHACLIGLLGGKLALLWRQSAEEDFKEALLDYLSSIFLRRAWVKQPLKFLVQCSPTAAVDCLSHPGIGTMFTRHYFNPSQPVGPIHFCGAEVSTRYIGTMAGAVLSGQCAAFQVLDQIRPQCLSSQDYAVLNQQKNACSPCRTDNWSLTIVSWSIFLPVVLIPLACFAFRMRDTYGRLLIPF